MFVVIENTPGYMPDSDDPATFEDIDAAKAYLSEEVSRYIDHLEETETPYEESRDERSVYITRTDSPHDLGRVFEIVEQEEEA